MKQKNSKDLKKHAELQRKSLDIIRVHNVTRDDRVIKWNMAINGQTWVVPSYKKDVGYGKGNQDVPRFIAEKFLKELIIHIINEKRKKWWEEAKENFKVGEYVHSFEAKHAIRWNNNKGKQVWEKYADKIWLGLVKEYGKDSYNEPQTDTYHHKGIKTEIIDSLSDKVLENKEKLLKEVQDEN